MNKAKRATTGPPEVKDIGVEVQAEFLSVVEMSIKLSGASCEEQRPSCLVENVERAT